MSAITITFGECAENHAGMQKLGAAAAAGFTVAELAEAKARFEAKGFECSLVDLVAEGRPGGAAEAAAVLVVRDGVRALGASAADLAAEQGRLAPDKSAFMYGRVVAKRARHNLCFAEAAQEPCYAEKKGRVVAFGDVPRLAAARAALPAFFGPKAAGLLAEGNYYYDVKRCGIGFHGDAERRLVVAFRLGAPIPLHFQWFLGGASVGARVALRLGPGDLYAMSAKAVGADWKRRKVPTLRHAAGAEKFLKIS
ncbi:MAG TPA: hypothetical protein VNI01_02290 [Elusimicrobiota bacterium]|nr:hypothetical protein [Elusimicrobiota bacterium]